MWRRRPAPCLRVLIPPVRRECASPWRANPRIALPSPTSTQKATLELIVSGNARKGDVLGTARVAGIMAAKRTSDLIPLCHPLALSKVTLEIAPDNKLPGCIVRATVKITGPTGVEMEALTAVSIACLTIYDMIKAVERGVRLESIHLVEKKGGKSGHYRA